MVALQLIVKNFINSEEMKGELYINELQGKIKTKERVSGIIYLLFKMKEKEPRGKNVKKSESGIINL